MRNGYTLRKLCLSTWIISSLLCLVDSADTNTLTKGDGPCSTSAFYLWTTTFAERGMSYCSKQCERCIEAHFDVFASFGDACLVTNSKGPYDFVYHNISVFAQEVAVQIPDDFTNYKNGWCRCKFTLTFRRMKPSFGETNCSLAAIARRLEVGNWMSERWESPGHYEKENIACRSVSLEELDIYSEAKGRYRDMYRAAHLSDGFDDANLMREALYSSYAAEQLARSLTRDFPGPNGYGRDRDLFVPRPAR